MFGFNAGLLGLDVTVILIPLKAALALFQLPLPLSHDEARQVGVELVLLVDASLLDAVPPLLLGNAQSAGDVVPKVEPLLLGQVVGCT